MAKNELVVFECFKTLSCVRKAKEVFICVSVQQKTNPLKILVGFYSTKIYLDRTAKSGGFQEVTTQTLTEMLKLYLSTYLYPLRVPLN